MASPIVITWKSSLYSTTAAATYTASPTWTPRSGALLIAFVQTAYSSSPVDPTGVTGHGATFTKLTLGTSTLSTTHKLSVWVAYAGASPTSTACVVSVSGTTTGASVIEFEVMGAYAGATPDLAIQDSTATNNGTGTAATVTLSAATESRNRAMIYVVNAANAAPTASGTWQLTVGAAGNYNSPTTGAAAFFDNGTFNTAGAATVSSSAWRMIGNEIKAAIIGAGGITITGKAPTASESGTL